MRLWLNRTNNVPEERRVMVTGVCQFDGRVYLSLTAIA
jgi:hypothetical protein